MASSGRTSPSRAPLFDRRAVLPALAHTTHRLLAVAVAMIVMFLVVVSVVPVVTGGSSFTVDSQLGPTAIPNGSLVFVDPVRARDIRAGDVLTTSETGSEVSTRRVVVVTRVDQILVEAAGGVGTEVLDETVIEGRVRFHLRSLGAVRDALTSPLALTALAGTALVLILRAVLDHRGMPVARQRVSGRRAEAGGPPVASDSGSEMKVQVLLAVLTDVDDVTLRFDLAEMGGSVVGGDEGQARLVRLVGTKDELDRAEVRLAELGHLDAVRRSDELSMPMPSPPPSSAAA